MEKLPRLDEYIGEVREHVETFITGPLFKFEPESPLKAIQDVLSRSDNGEKELIQYEITLALAILKLTYDKCISEPDFWDALVLRLREDNVEWGDTWRTRDIRGQTGRTMRSFRKYADKLTNGEPDPAEMLLRASGNMFICLVRYLDPNYKVKKAY